MALTPQMRQSINLLGMSSKDLSEYIDSILTKNPFLQKLIDEKKSEKYRKSSGLRADGDAYDHVAGTAQPENPRFTLISQMKITGLDKETLKIAEYLIFEMDENGYITVDPEAAAADLSVEMEEVERCISLIQHMEPAGIGARDVRECLLLQLERSGKKDSLEHNIVSGFLADLARNDIEKIAASLSAEKDKVKDAISHIKRLNPRPASTILSTKTTAVTPELVAKVGAKVLLELNRACTPRLKIYNPYENEMNIVKDDETRKFLKENIDLAKGLLDNLKRREDTICKVAKYILDFQKEAISKDKPLKTLTLKDVATALSFHPSTVSRAMSNKYIQVNNKVLAINSLLSHGIKKENGELTSKALIKNRIAELVKSENRSSPLNDSDIETALKQEGIIIKRRTVAKYRQALKILPTSLRKKLS